MKYMIKYLTLVLAMMMNSNVMAETFPTDVKQQKVERAITIEGSNKYSNIFLDEEVYHYAAEDLSDIRIIDDEGKNVPYYIYNAGTLQDYHKEKESSYEMTTDNARKISVINIDNRQRLWISRFLLKIEGRFNRTYTLWGIDREGTTDKIGTGSLSTDINAQSSDVAIDLTMDKVYESYRIEIENLDDKPLEVSQVKEVYRIDKLVFETKVGRHYALTYGDNNLSAPQYDIVYYIQDIERLEQNTCSLGDNTIIELGKNVLRQGKDFTVLFKTLMGVTSAVLIVAIVGANKKMNQGHK